ncbi:MAG: AraC family transcriptional regulator [Variovorax sp.]|nr:AraC family transcriptional regulator [Variovorax sp.]
MQAITTDDILTWSTSEVPASQRFDYFADALSSALVPMGVEIETPSRDGFHAEMTLAELGPMAISRQSGSAHCSYRRAPELSRSGEHSFHLIINLVSSWTLAHRGEVRLAPGDAVLADSSFGHELHMPGRYECMHLKLSGDWLRRWVRDPSVLVGRRIAADSSWGRALTSFASQLTPQFFVDSPLPQGLLVDQIGALLALVASEFGAAPKKDCTSDAALRERIQACILERCAEPGLCAGQVAESLGIPDDVLHRTLSAVGESFGELLAATRTGIASRMLGSSIFKRLSVDEIARRTGFGDSQHLELTLRSRTGRTPWQLRGH